MRCCALIATLSACLVSNITLAGPLTPPAGAPASTHKTLTEVEPRIAINAINTPGNAGNSFIISQPGSYYLTGNILGEAGKSGIFISGKNVTLDLNGFEIRGVLGATFGVFMSAFREDIVIRNGIVSNWPSGGIRTKIDVGRIENITASNNGGWGIDNDGPSTFSTSIIRCEFFRNGGLVANTGGARGGFHTRVSECHFIQNTGASIQVAWRSHVLNNTISEPLSNATIGSTGRGIFATNARNVVITGNMISTAFTGVGIEVGLASGNDAILVDDNRIVDCSTGILVRSSGNIITRNFVGTCTTPFNIAAGNRCFAVQHPATGAFAGATGGVAPTTNPWANFSY